LILVDTSVWVDHLRHGDRQLVALLDEARVVSHPLVVGEIACGGLANRSAVLRHLQDLPMATVAGDDELLAFVERQALYGRGIGLVDAHLLAATMLTSGTALWTRDARLRDVAGGLGCAYAEPEGR
jgi:predicted nucleic acid-binding protein